MMKLIRMADAARMLKLTREQLAERQRGNYIRVHGYRMRVYQEHPGALRFLDAREVLRVRAHLARRELS